MVLKKSFRVWRKYRPRSVLLESKEIPGQALLFEAGAIAILSPVEFDIIRRECCYNDSVSAYGCLGVLAVDSGSQTFHYLVLVSECLSLGKINDTEIFRVTQTMFAPLNHKANLDLVQDVGKILASGHFYFAYPSFGATFDLLVCYQKQGKPQPQFFWNRTLFSYMRRFGVDCEKWLYRVMCGSVHIQTVYAASKHARVCLISRLSCERAGTRFNVRGMNDEGHVANFVETEMALFVGNTVASFVQVRGLVPLFWEQPGIQTGAIRIKFSRGYTCSQPAFERHFEWSLLHYGPQLCLNLLGTKDQEQMLSLAFQEHLAQLSSAYCAEMVCFDYHRHCRGMVAETQLTNHLLPLLRDFISSNGYFLSVDGNVHKTQVGTIRTNCLDCLDRTNGAQTFLGLHMLEELMAVVGLSTKASLVLRFKQLLSASWSQNGDSLSILYAGTRALQGKISLKDGARSVQRTIQNNFMDANKQEAIDMLLLSNGYTGELGQKARALLEPADALAPVPFKQAVCDRWSDFTVPEKLRVCVGTWNVNGGKHIHSIALKGQSLHDWLLDAPRLSGAAKTHPLEFANPPDVYAIGFEELVGLTASNIVSASSTNKRAWGDELKKVLSRDTPYELVAAEQLVGVCLYIFIRPCYIPYIRDVAVSSVKTGLSGKAGNKGGVAIRFLLHGTSIAFVCSHFAAHQTKITERNQDYADICRKVQFPHGQSVDTQDYVFWCGDLNYRVDLPTNVSKEHIANQRWDKLARQDQLIKQKKLRKVFQGFVEGELNFAPTYKYDEFSDDYDTSEKCRTPAWCDRVLWKRKSWLPQPKTLYTKQYISPHMPEVAEGEEEEGVSDGRWEFGLHPSDAAGVCAWQMGAGGREELVQVGHSWHPGRLLYYGRSELKQSDHRPVVALIEVEIYRVNTKQLKQVKEEVALALGPLDPTIVVCEREEGAVLDIPLLLNFLKPIGEVVLVRVTDDGTLVTFRRSPSALAATALHGKEIGGVRVDVYLRSPWPPSGDGDDENATGAANPASAATTGKKMIRRATVSVLTSEQLLGADSFAGEDDEDLMEFSFSQEPTDENCESAEEVKDEVSDSLSSLEEVPKAPQRPPRPSQQPTRPARPASQPSRPPRPSSSSSSSSSSLPSSSPSPPQQPSVEQPLPHPHSADDLQQLSRPPRLAVTRNRAQSTTAAASQQLDTPPVPKRPTSPTPSVPVRPRAGSTKLETPMVPKRPSSPTRAHSSSRDEGSKGATPPRDEGSKGAATPPNRPPPPKRT